ncbi:three-helix bundle dimerization domain-containing protein [Mycolicibacterium alvei]|uniref:Uncharacterized protein n=1 Tax=Mycolicibacterium alvei TaxID=67081 RepID=A0A6N4UYG1_9MYCO|nr:hypothetical protein [Mycolicibacterium alvei]MCV7000174.1 hypothetical protein [Mycolicibacterium alvei]BBX29438.1 hypothetical protein MALV_45630 [Mycolicibacterium alvei]
MIEVAEETVLDDIERRLIHDFPYATAEEIATAVHRAHGRFDTSPIRDFIPLFVEKQVRRQFMRPTAANSV